MNRTEIAGRNLLITFFVLWVIMDFTSNAFTTVSFGQGELVLTSLRLLLTAGLAMWNFGPNWYPVALTLMALPGAWLGGVLHWKLDGKENDHAARAALCP